MNNDRISNKSKQAIVAFMNEPIGFMKVVLLQDLELIIIPELKNTNQNTTFGMAQVWFEIWSTDYEWTEDFILELEERASAAQPSDKQELLILHQLIPYDSGGTFKERIDQLHTVIRAKMHQ